MTPAGDRIVVRPIPRETSTASGLVLPESKEKPQEGTVVAVGPGRWLESGDREPMDVAVGERVIYARYAGHELDDGNLVIRQPDILAIVETA